MSMKSQRELHVQYAVVTFLSRSLSATFFYLGQVFDSKESLSTAAECVKVAKEHCQQLTEIGLDLTFMLQSLLVKDVRAALQSYKDIIIEATKHRNSEEMWRRMNLMTPEALTKLKVLRVTALNLCILSYQ